MRANFSHFFDSITLGALAPKAFLASSLPAVVLMAWALSVTPARAQDSDDLYGLPGAGSAPTAVQVDTVTDTAAITPVVPPVADTAAVITPVVPAPRARITRETTINPMDQKKGAYRNPKKALFMSLIVPGLGQAYVGQSAFTYARAAFYFGTEITLGLMWYQYTVVKYDRKTKQYRQFADTAWSQQGYEDAAFAASLTVGNASFRDLNFQRRNYCDAVQERETSTGNDILHPGCLELTDTIQTSKYQQFRTKYVDQSSPEATSAFRATFADPVDFYALIGDYQEFIGGWNDVSSLAYSADSISGSSDNRTIYNSMRKEAQDLSRMQAWFIGGIVINHIASAVDAALTARHNNRVLYEGEARWYDRMKVDGGMAFAGGRPYTHITARLSF